MGRQTVEEYYEIIHKTKSIVISITTRIEHEIEAILSTKFANSDEDFRKFNVIFFNDDIELTFNDKIKMLERFLKEYHVDFSNEHSDFIKSLHRVRRLRNDFAHSINPEDEDLSKILGKNLIILWSVENGVIKKKEFPIKDLVERIDDSTKIFKLLHKIFTSIEKQSKTITN